MLRALPVIVWLCGPAPRLRCGPAPSPPGRFARAGGGVVEYPGKVACPSGRRCSTRNAVWCQSHPGFKSQRYRHCRPAPLGPGGFVMPTWCGGLAAPTNLRPPRGLPAREPSAQRASLGASLRCPARPCRPRGGLQSGGVSVCCLAWPRRHPPAPRQVPPVPSGALHTSGARSLMLLGALACCLARPRRLLWASRGSRVLSFWGGLVCVVTNVVNLMAFWLKMVVTGQFAR